MKADLDLSAIRAAIAADPWTSAAVAFAAGACIALVEPRGRLARAIASTVGAVVLATLREAAVRRLRSALLDDAQTAFRVNPAMG